MFIKIDSFSVPVVQTKTVTAFKCPIQGLVQVYSITYIGTEHFQIRRNEIRESVNVRILEQGNHHLRLETVLSCIFVNVDRNSPVDDLFPVLLPDQTRETEQTNTQILQPHQSSYRQVGLNTGPGHISQCRTTSLHNVGLNTSLQQNTLRTRTNTRSRSCHNPNIEMQG